VAQLRDFGRDLLAMLLGEGFAVDQAGAHGVAGLSGLAVGVGSGSGV
jgi:hypothetical protein